MLLPTLSAAVAADYPAAFLFYISKNHIQTQTSLKTVIIGLKSSGKQNVIDVFFIIDVIELVANFPMENGVNGRRNPYPEVVSQSLIDVEKIFFVDGDIVGKKGLAGFGIVKSGTGAEDHPKAISRQGRKIATYKKSVIVVFKFLLTDQNAADRILEIKLWFGDIGVVFHAQLNVLQASGEAGSDGYKTR